MFDISTRQEAPSVSDISGFKQFLNAAPVHLAMLVCVEKLNNFEYFSKILIVAFKYKATANTAEQQQANHQKNFKYITS